MQIRIHMYGQEEDFGIVRELLLQPSHQDGGVGALVESHRAAHAGRAHVALHVPVLNVVEFLLDQRHGLRATPLLGHFRRTLRG